MHVYVHFIETSEDVVAADMLLGPHAGLAVGSHTIAAGSPQSAVLPQSLLMAQHAGAQQLMLARQDPTPLLSTHAGLLGQHGLQTAAAAASGMAMLPGLAAPGLHDYQHGLLGHQQSAEIQPGLRPPAPSGGNSGLQLQGSGWPPSEDRSQPSTVHDTADRSRSYVQLFILFEHLLKCTATSRS